MIKAIEIVVILTALIIATLVVTNKAEEHYYDDNGELQFDQTQHCHLPNGDTKMDCKGVKDGCTPDAPGDKCESVVTK